MSDIEIMEFPYGAFLKVRLEFVLLRDNELEAKIMRIIEGWMIDQKKAWLNACTQAAADNKPEPPEPDYYVTLSYAQIIAQLYMFNSSRKGDGKEVVEGKENTISRRTVSKAMQALIDDKVVFTRPNPNLTKEYDAAQYKLNCPLVQKQMKLLPKNPMSYLGSNGRIDGTPCANFSHPPCETVSHPMQNNFTSPRENSASGDVKNFPTLIDISNRDKNRMIERGNDPTESTAPETSLIPSLTSLSQVEHLSTIGVDKQANGVDNTQLPIATVTTRNASTTPNAHRDTEPLSPPSLSPEGQRIDGYLKKLRFPYPRTQENFDYLAVVAEHVETFEQMKSYYDFTRGRFSGGIFCANLANLNNMSRWVQEQEPPVEKPKPAKQKVKITQEYLDSLPV